MDNETLERLTAERDELRIKLDALDAFMLSKKFEMLPGLDQLLLTEQIKHMSSYLTVLDIRVKKEQ